MTYYGIQFGGPHLEHHGILGMKWGVRRYQNKDGSLTTAGRKRYQLSMGYPKKRDWSKHGAPKIDSKKMLNDIKEHMPDDYEKMRVLKKNAVRSSTICD